MWSLEGATGGDLGSQRSATIPLDSSNVIGIRGGDGDFPVVGGSQRSTSGAGLGIAVTLLWESDWAAHAPNPDGQAADCQGGRRAVSAPDAASAGPSSSPSEGPGGSGDGKGSSTDIGGRGIVRPDLHGPTLQNHSNVCYVNSCCHLLRWMGLQENFQFAFGRLSVAMRSLSSKGRVHLLSLMPWQQATTGWRQIHRQHDAAEFVHFLLGYSKPAAYRGQWEARISRDDSPVGFELRDSGDCCAPLAIGITGRTLQHCIVHWHIHGQVHALTVPPAFLFLQLNRFARTQLKLSSKLEIWCESRVFTVLKISRPTLSSMRSEV